MSADRDTTRIVRSWLRAEENESADRVLNFVLDQLDTTPQRRVTWWPARRFPTLNNSVRIALAAAAAVAAIVIGVSVFSGRNVGDEQPAPSLSPTPAATGLTALGGPGSLAPGTYLIDDPFPIRATITVPEQWQSLRVDHRIAMVCVAGEGCDAGSRPGVGLWIVDDIPPPCSDAGETAAPTPQTDLGPTVDDLAAALTAQAGFNVVSGPTPTTFSGYDGVEMELLTALGGLSCPNGMGQGWEAGLWRRETFSGERSQLLILDVDGVRVLIDGMSLSDTSEANVAEMQSVFDSIQIQGLSGSGS